MKNYRLWRPSVTRYFLLLITILVVTIFLQRFSYAAQNNYFHLPSYSERLSNLWVTAILEDQQGYIWIGTEEGLNRLDSQRVLSLKGTSAAELGLLDSYIWDLANIDNERILVATTTGLFIYSYRQNRFAQFGQAELFSHYQGGGVFSLSTGHDGDIWILALKGLYQLSANASELKDWSHFLKRIPNSLDNDFIAIEAIDKNQAYIATRHQIYLIDSQNGKIEAIFDKEQFPNLLGRISSLALDSQSLLWVGTGQGVVTINPNGKVSQVEALKEHYASEILPQQNGKVWIASRKGLLEYDLIKNQLQIHQAYNQSQYQIQKRRLSRLTQDNHGTIWVGTRGAGINLYLPPASKVEVLNDSSEKPFALINNDVWAIHEDDQIYIVATNSGVQLYDKINNRSRQLDLVKEEVSNSSDEVIYVVRRLGEDYLLGGENGIFLLDFKNLTTSRLAYPLAGYPAKNERVLDIEVTQQVIYLATDKGVYIISRTSDQHSVLGAPQGLENTEIKDIEIDNEGNLWLGTRQGVSVLPQGRSQFLHYLQTAGDEILVDEVSKLLLLRPGMMAVSFYNKGLFGIDFHKGFANSQILDLNKTYGLTYKNIFSLVRADDKHLLLGTDQGLYKVNIHKNVAEMYGKSDGLASAEFNEGAAFCSNQWGCSLGSSAGVLKVSINDLRHRISQTEIRASELKIHFPEKDELWSLLPEKEVTVPAGHSGVSLKFTTQNYLDSHSTRFEYRLLPLQSKFIELGSSGELFLSSLPPGIYQMEVKASFNNISSQKNYLLNLSVLAHWWQKPFAKLGLIIILFLIISLIIYNRVNYVKRIKGYNEKLNQREQTLNLALWASDAGTWQWDSFDNLVTINQSKLAEKNIDETQFHQDQWLEKILAEYKTAIFQRWREYINNPIGSYNDEYPVQQTTNEIRWLNISGKAVVLTENNKAKKIVGTFKDVTKQKSQEEEYLLFGQAFESSNEGIIILDDAIITRGVNPAAERISGLSKSELFEIPIKNLFGGISRHKYRQIFKLVKKQGSWQGEASLKISSNKDCHVWLNITQMIQDEHKKHFILFFSDITENKKTDRAIRQLTDYDVLTGLANRKLFEEHLSFSLQHAKANKTRLALLFVDLVRFKAINDRYGHNIGDLVLHKAAQRMYSVLADDDLIARFGGDKFVVLLNSPSSSRNIDQSCYQLSSAFEDDIHIEEKYFRLGITIGISIWPEDDENGDQLIKHAEMAMYHAKQSGRNNFQYFSAGQHEKELQKLKIEQELVKAIDKEQFELYYQAQIDAKTNKVIGVEALIRWKHSSMGFISPELFIPITEANGLIIPLSNWVLETAIKTALLWKEELDHEFKMAVNISGLHFNQAYFAQSIISLLEKYQLPPKYLSLEITEGMLISDIEKPLQALQQLKSLGIHIAIDDFGTGYSSLAYLKMFPVTCLKIDKSFVLNLCNDKDDQAIVNSVISLGHFLGFEVLAEGVEDRQAYNMLQQMGCDQVQGYYFSKPLPADKALEFIKSFSFESF